MRALWRYPIHDVADWNKRDILGVTPLMKAASAGNMYFVEQILKNGADINLKD